MTMMTVKMERMKDMMEVEVEEEKACNVGALIVMDLLMHARTVPVMENITIMVMEDMVEDMEEMAVVVSVETPLFQRPLVITFAKVGALFARTMVKRTPLTMTMTMTRTRTRTQLTMKRTHQLISFMPKSRA